MKGERGASLTEPTQTRSVVRVRGMADLTAIALVIVALRLLGFEEVFQDGLATFLPSDPQYHLRRAFYTYVHFPSVLFFDPYMNFPAGAPVPWPPLFDFVAGGFAHFVAADQSGFERVMAWTGPVCSLLTGIPIYWAGCRVAHRGIGLAAGLLFALLPVAIHAGSLANPDHHAAVSMIGAWLLFLCLALVDPAIPRWRLVRFSVALAVVRVALILCWSGSLLYLVVVEGVLLLAAVISRSRRLALAHSLSAFGASVGLLPFLLMFPTPLGGAYSSIAFSWLHWLAMTGASLTAAWLWVLLPRLPTRSVWTLIGVTLAGAAGLVLLVLLVPGPREGLLPGLQFLTMNDSTGQLITEQRSLFPIFGRAASRNTLLEWGWFAYLIPFSPLGPLLYARRSGVSQAAQNAAWVLAVWAAFFGVLTIAQGRYGADFAPAASLVFVLLLAVVIGWGLDCMPRIRYPRQVAATAGILLGALLMRPAFEFVLLPKAHRSISALFGDDRPAKIASIGVPATLMRFMDQVRRSTPETSSYLGGDRRPEYGVLANPNLGHAIQYRARRPSSANPFFSYIGEANWGHALGFLHVRGENDALATAKTLAARYVITMPYPGLERVVARLHAADGNAVDGHERLVHFRLITESLGRGNSIMARHRPDPPGTRPYKLFEIVEGAILEVATEAGGVVTSALTLRTPAGRRFVYRSRARAGPDDIARLRLPYATDRRTPVHAAGPYVLEREGRRISVHVSERQVVEGETLRLD